MKNLEYEVTITAEDDEGTTITSTKSFNETADDILSSIKETYADQGCNERDLFEHLQDNNVVKYIGYDDDFCNKEGYDIAIYEVDKDTIINRIIRVIHESINCAISEHGHIVMYETFDIDDHSYGSVDKIKFTSNIDEVKTKLIKAIISRFTDHEEEIEVREKIAA